MTCTVEVARKGGAVEVGIGVIPVRGDYRGGKFAWAEVDIGGKDEIFIVVSGVARQCCQVSGGGDFVRVARGACPAGVFSKTGISRTDE